MKHILSELGATLTILLYKTAKGIKIEREQNFPWIIKQMLIQYHLYLHYDLTSNQKLDRYDLCAPLKVFKKYGV